MDFESYDVLVVGGGLAGIRAAIAAVETNPRVKVGMVSKVYPMRSHTVSAEGGAAAALRPEDSYENHAFDTVKGSDYLADQDVVEAFVREAPLELIQMEHWGCPWSRDPDGKISARPFGGMTTWRTCFAADKSGFHMLHTVFQTSLKYPQIVRHDEAFVTRLLVEDSRCVGVAALDMKTGRIDAITAKATILATGGLGRVYAFTTNGNICTGDGMALAYRAGAGLKDMEMVQFHPTGLPFTGILITEAVRGEGGYLTNKEGERAKLNEFASKLAEDQTTCSNHECFLPLRRTRSPESSIHTQLKPSVGINRKIVGRSVFFERKPKMKAGRKGPHRSSTVCKDSCRLEK